MSAAENLGGQWTQTVHRGLRVLIPTKEYERDVQPHLDRGDHDAAADAVLRRVTNFRDDRPIEKGREGIGTHWSDRRRSIPGETYGLGRRTGADRFAGDVVGRSADHTGDDVTVPVLLRGVVHPSSIDLAPPSHRAVFQKDIEGEVPIKTGAPISLRSAHVGFADAVPTTEEIIPGLHDGHSPVTRVVKRRVMTSYPA